MPVSPGRRATRGRALTYTRRRIQITCFVLFHIPLLACAIYAARSGVSAHLAILLVSFLATLVGAVAVVIYLGRTLPEPRALT